MRWQRCYGEYGGLLGGFKGVEYKLPCSHGRIFLGDVNVRSVCVCVSEGRQVRCMLESGK